MTRTGGTIQRLLADLGSSVDVASIAVFRALFGATLFADLLLYTRESISYHWLEPKILFTYFGFEWVHILPGNGMFALVALLRILALMIAIGFLYRPACILFFAGFAYLFLLDQSEFLNHSYLICLLSFLMIFIPAHRAWSIDALLRPSCRSDVAPAWNLWILRFQVGVVYFFAGLAKITPDWLHGEPVRLWTKAPDPVVYFMCCGGLLFDLLIVPLLLCRKTRPWAFAAAVAFHLTNAFLFKIGMFPWVMLAATTLFLDPSWPRPLLRLPSVLRPPSSVISPTLTTLLTLYALTQLLLPLRHLLYPGNVNWTEQGHRFSWRMKLRDKLGSVRFFVTDPAEKRTWFVDPVDYINPVQALRMAGQPDQILQFAHFLARDAEANGHGPVQVRARVMTSLNGRRAALLVDPEADLASVPRSLKPASWIMPLTEPLPDHPVAVAPENPTRAERDLVVIARLIEEQRTNVRALDREMQDRFHVNPNGTYRYDAETRTLYEGVVDESGHAKEVVNFKDPERANRFIQLVTDKRTCNNIIAGLSQIEATKMKSLRDSGLGL